MVTWKTGWERIRSYAGVEVRVPRRLERLTCGLLLLLAESTKTTPVDDIDRRRRSDDIDLIMLFCSI